MVETATAPASEPAPAPAPGITPASSGPTLIGGDLTGGDSTPASTEAGAGADTQPASGADSISGAPEKYDFTLPDGFEANPESMGQFETFARTANLSQERAQELLDLHVGQLKASAEAFTKAQTTAWETTLKGWREEVTSDPLFAGDKLVSAQTVIGKALDQYGSKEAREAFALTGAGDNPALFRFVHSMAKALSEATVVPPGSPPNGGKPKTVGEALYGPTPAA